MQRSLLIAAWLLVLAPLSWGVARSVQRSMPLFTAGASKTDGNAPSAPSTTSGSGPDAPMNRTGAPTGARP